MISDKELRQEAVNFIVGPDNMTGCHEDWIENEKYSEHVENDVKELYALFLKIRTGTKIPAETIELFYKLRARLDKAFSPETAQPGTIAKENSPKSIGHCAVVAVLVHERFGGCYMSATFKGVSHWFNRIKIGSEFYDVDLTGDQFDKPPVQIVPEGSLYTVNLRARLPEEITKETLERALRLEVRMSLNDEK